MNTDKKIEIASDAVAALIAALKAHIKGNRRDRQAAIAEAERRLFKLKRVSAAPFKWSIHHDLPDPEVNVKREVKLTVQHMQLEIVKGTFSAGAVALRYLKRFGALIGVPDLHTRFIEHCEVA